MKFFFYVVGILILTIGISFTIQSDLGTSPFGRTVYPCGFYGRYLGNNHCFDIRCNSLLKKQKPEVWGLLTAFITGVSIDMWLFLLDTFHTPELWYSKAVYIGIGLVIIGLGTAIYLHTNFAPIPVDRLTLIIQELTRTNIFFRDH